MHRQLDDILIRRGSDGAVERILPGSMLLLSSVLSGQVVPLL